MRAASAGHNDQERVRQRGATTDDLARQSGRWCDMENRRAAQHYSKRRFKVHVRFMMPCRAQMLSNQVGERQGISLAGQNS